VKFIASTQSFAVIQCFWH